jgi:hypothetical protein
LLYQRPTAPLRQLFIVDFKDRAEPVSAMITSSGPCRLGVFGDGFANEYGSHPSGASPGNPSGGLSYNQGHVDRTILMRLLASASVIALIAVAGCNVSRPIKVQAKDAPGTYLFEGHESRDELVLNSDGRFTRTAVYGGVRQIQTGRWEVDSSSPYSQAMFREMQLAVLRQPGVLQVVTEISHARFF